MDERNIFWRIVTDFLYFVGDILYAVFVMPFVFIFDFALQFLEDTHLFASDNERVRKVLKYGVAGPFVGLAILLVGISVLALLF